MARGRKRSITSVPEKRDPETFDFSDLVNDVQPILDNAEARIQVLDARINAAQVERTLIIDLRDAIVRNADVPV